MKKTLIKNLALILTLLVLVTFQVSATYPPVVYFGDLPSTASYVIETDGTSYWSVRYDGYTSASSTNASYIFDQTVIENTTVLLKVGTYQIDTLIPIDVSRYQLVGENWGSQISVGASGGFNITSTSDLFDITFSNLQFYGASTSQYCITSAMANNKRIAHFTFMNNRVQNFVLAGTIALNLTNLEVSEISHNYFYDTRTAFIQLGSVNYHMGNDWIEDNVFYFSTVIADVNGIRLTTIANDGTYGTIYAIWGTNNQFFAPTTSVRALAWNLTTISGAMESITLTGDRCERVQLVATDSSDSYKIRKIIIDKATLWSDETQAGMKMINLDATTRSCIISHSQFQVENDTSYYFMDNYTADAKYANQFNDNIFISAVNALMSASSLTYTQGIGFEARGINATAADGGQQAISGLYGIPTYVFLTSGNSTNNVICSAYGLASGHFHYHFNATSGQTVYWYAVYDP